MNEHNENTVDVEKTEYVRERKDWSRLTTMIAHYNIYGKLIKTVVCHSDGVVTTRHQPRELLY